ncbi:MAG: hypothetical protein WAZ77_21205 [Candidatus Nitrosopolaris sp.]|jgi:hypothetical protein
MRDRISDYDSSFSTILTTRFGHESAKLIHSVEKNLYIVIGLIASIAVLSILNIMGALHYLSSNSEGVDKTVDILLLLILIVVLVPLFLLLLKSRNVLDRWTDMFERNTIATTMSIAMTDKSQEAIVLALMQSVEQISEPLQEYINSKRNNLAEFLNVSLDNNDTNLRFDILMDANHVLDDGGGSSSINNNFRQVLKEYGAVIIKILDGVIDRHHVESFADSLSKYGSITKNKVGLGLIISEELTDEAREYASKISSHRKRGINHLILITKTPSYQRSSKDQEQTSTI